MCPELAQPIGEEEVAFSDPAVEAALSEGEAGADTEGVVLQATDLSTEAAEVSELDGTGIRLIDYHHD